MKKKTLYLTLGAAAAVGAAIIIKRIANESRYYDLEDLDDLLADDLEEEETETKMQTNKESQEIKKDIETKEEKDTTNTKQETQDHPVKEVEEIKIEKTIKTTRAKKTVKKDEPDMEKEMKEED